MAKPAILVGYDHSEGSTGALGWALDEAAQTDSPVLIVHASEWLTVTPPVVIGAQPWPDERARQGAQEALDAVVSAASQQHPEVIVRGALADGPAAQRLTEMSHDAALIVLGSRGHGGFTGLLLGSTAIAVSAHAHCPVVIRPADRLGRPDGEVVVGVDRSPSSLIALDYAFDTAARHGTNLYVLGVWNIPSLPWRPPGLDAEQIRITEEQELRDLVEQKRSRQPDVPVRAEVVIDNPAHALTQAGAQGRLLVVGSRGRGGLTGLLLGSVSHQALQHAQCPVAVVREHSPA